MKISFIIVISLYIGFIFCSTNLIDINIATDYTIDANNKNLYPNKIIPKDSTFYFRLQDIGVLNKILLLKTDPEIKNCFIVKYSYFNETPSGSEIDNKENWETVGLIHQYDNNINYFSIYYLDIPENIQCVLISITLKNDLNYFCINVKNERNKNEMIYDIRYFNTYLLDVDNYKNGKTKFALKSLEKHIGDTFLKVLTFPMKPKELSFKAIGLKTGTEEELNKELEKDNPNYIDIKLNRTDSDGLYYFYFKLDENSKYIYITFEIFEKLFMLGVKIYYPESDVPSSPTYRITTLKEYEIDMKNLTNNNIDHLNIKTTDYHYGDGFIQFKVKKGVPKETFYLDGTGYVQNNESSNETISESTTLIIKYNKTFHKKKYDIHQYYINKTESAVSFFIQLYIDKNIDYLSVKIDSKSEKDEDEDDNNSISLVVIIIIIACILIALVVIYLILRKLGIIGKNDISSKDIDSNNNQLIPKD